MSTERTRPAPEPPATPLVDIDAVWHAYGPNGDAVKAWGVELRRRRRAAGISRARLAALADCNATTIYRIETGATIPRDYMRLAIAAALGCSAADIWGWPDAGELVADYPAAAGA